MCCIMMYHVTYQRTNSCLCSCRCFHLDTGLLLHLSKIWSHAGLTNHTSCVQNSSWSPNREFKVYIGACFPRFCLRHNNFKQQTYASLTPNRPWGYAMILLHLLQMCTALEVHASHGWGQPWIVAVLTCVGGWRKPKRRFNCKGTTMGQGSVNATFAYDKLTDCLRRAYGKFQSDIKKTRAVKKIANVLVCFPYMQWQHHHHHHHHHQHSIPSMAHNLIRAPAIMARHGLTNGLRQHVQLLTAYETQGKSYYLMEFIPAQY